MLIWFPLLFRFKKFDNRFLKKILIREHQPKSSLVSLYKKMEIKQVIEMVESGVMKPTPPKAPALWVSSFSGRRKDKWRGGGGTSEYSNWIASSKLSMFYGPVHMCMHITLSVVIWLPSLVIIYLEFLLFFLQMRVQSGLSYFPTFLHIIATLTLWGQLGWEREELT